MIYSLQNTIVLLSALMSQISRQNVLSYGVSCPAVTLL